MKKLLFAILVCSPVIGLLAKPVEISSPDGKYRMTVEDASGRMLYSIQYEDREIVLPSQMGISAGCSWLDGLTVEDCAYGTSDTVWDDTQVLDGEPGQFITIARRHGEEWFVGTICNEARTATVDCGFLPKGTYIAEVYADGDTAVPTRTHVRCTKFKVTRKTCLKFKLRHNGGAAVRIVPKTTADKGVKSYKENLI